VIDSPPMAPRGGQQEHRNHGESGQIIFSEINPENFQQIKSPPARPLPKKIFGITGSGFFWKIRGSILI
jgi:hypothetical protein